MLVPCDEGHPNIEGCDYGPMEVTTVAANEMAKEAAQELLTPKEISRIRGLLMSRNRGFVLKTIH